LSNKEREAFRIEDFKGLYWRHPWLAATFTAMLFSLAGIPLTAGFIGKFYVLSAGVDKTLWALVIILAINSAIGLFYYLRIVVEMFTKSEAEKTNVKFSLVTSVALTVLTVLLIYLGVFPSALIRIIQIML
ncbi:MAG: NADH-quinone oxidoreductase subunit N, partial [Ignavibacteriaceae bacterium]|nr:NADH-quinone oxidoreductase subunit N [Ignavibacteriaceae bacterium]